MGVVVATEKGPIVSDPELVQDPPEWKPGPPALPWRAVLVGLVCALAVVFFVAVFREFGKGERDHPFGFLQAGVCFGMLTGFLVRCMGGRGRRAISFVFWVLVAGAVIGNVVGGMWDFHYGCAWSEPAPDLSHAISRRFDSQFGFGLAGLVVMAFAGLSARTLYEIWRDRRSNG